MDKPDIWVQPWESTVKKKIDFPEFLFFFWVQPQEFTVKVENWLSRLSFLSSIHARELSLSHTYIQNNKQNKNLKKSIKHCFSTIGCNLLLGLHIYALTHICNNSKKRVHVLKGCEEKIPGRGEEEKEEMGNWCNYILIWKYEKYMQ